MVALFDHDGCFISESRLSTLQIARVTSDACCCCCSFLWMCPSTRLNYGIIYLLQRASLCLVLASTLLLVASSQRSRASSSCLCGRGCLLLWRQGRGEHGKL